MEDEYLFGSDILVAPLLETNSNGRDVYLPPGQWIDYQTGKAYSGGWQNIRAGAIPVVMMMREGAILLYIKLAQSTKNIDWANLDLVVYVTNAQTAQGQQELTGPRPPSADTGGKTRSSVSRAASGARSTRNDPTASYGSSRRRD